MKKRLYLRWQLSRYWIWKHRKGFLILLILVFLSTVGLMVSGVWKEKQEKVYADKIYSHVFNAVQSFPISRAATITVHCSMEGVQYLYYTDGSIPITGIRTATGEVTYYSAGKSWTWNGEVFVAENCADPVEPVICAYLTELLQQNIMHTYYHAQERDLPLWVFPGEYYIRCQREPALAGMEVMAVDDPENPQYLRWDICNSAEDVLLYVWMAEKTYKNKVGILNQWDNLEELKCQLELA